MESLPEDKLSIAMTKTPLIKGVPVGYMFFVGIAGMGAFFVCQYTKVNFFATLLIAGMIALAIYMTGKEITRQDDRQLFIIGHYLITRWLPDVIEAIVTLKRRDRSTYKGLWYDL